MRIATVNDVDKTIVAFVQSDDGEIQVFSFPGMEESNMTFVRQAAENPEMDVEEFIGSGWSYYDTDMAEVEEDEAGQMLEGLVPLSQA